MQGRGHGASFTGEAPQDFRTGFTGEVSAVAVCDCTASQAPSSRTKAVIVILLRWLLAWRPWLAMMLGRLVLRLWPNFQE